MWGCTSQSTMINTDDRWSNTASDLKSWTNNANQWTVGCLIWLSMILALIFFKHVGSYSSLTALTLLLCVWWDHMTSKHSNQKLMRPCWPRGHISCVFMSENKLQRVVFFCLITCEPGEAVIVWAVSLNHLQSAASRGSECGFVWACVCLEKFRAHCFS